MARLPDPPGIVDPASLAGIRARGVDGGGFRELQVVNSPIGLVLRVEGDEIALETRMITTADIFDALTAERPYRAAMPITKALAIMAEMVGTQIDARCFEALERSLARTDATLVT